MAKYKYPNAGKQAPAEVKKAIADFRRLPIVTKRDLPLLYYILGDGTPPYKMDPKDADYVGHSVNGQNCANCDSAYLHVGSQTYICDQIRDDIEPEAWCRLWNPT